jgi:DNA polymerase-1
MVKKFVLIDAFSIIFRSFYAFIQNPLRNSKGEVTSGIFGFLNTLEKIKQNIGSDYVGLCFDAPGKTFRDEVFEAYKATRPPPPPDIPFQIIKVKEICQHLGIARFELEGYEADDLLATFAKQLKDHGIVYIASSDKDLMQVVSDNVFMYDAYKDLIYDRDQVIKKFGVPPDRVGDYLALTGDTIDNIPGVPGIGPKRAVAILEKFDRFEDALTQDPRIAAHREQALLSRKLVELACDVPLTVTPDALKTRPPDMDRLLPVLYDLELHSYIKTIAARAPAALKVVPASTLPAVKPGGAIGFFITEDGECCLSTGNTDVVRVPLDKARSLFTDARITKIGYGLKPNIARYGMVPPYFDIEIAAWLIDPNRSKHKFEDIVLHNLNIIARPDPESIAHYGYEVWPVLIAKMDRQIEVYDRIEAPLIQVLVNMEERGIRIDISYFKTLSRDFGDEIKKIEKKVHALAGRKFNINSPKQLSVILFEDLGLKPARKGKTHYSTSVDVLQELSRVHDLPKEVLRFREFTKIKSTYIDPLMNLARDDRIHTTFNQTGTSTGRLSSSDPNIQNIPIRTEVGRQIRKGFIADQGYVLVSADYSQIELRLLAHITGDEALTKAFKQKKDIHRHTASLVFNIPEHEVDENKRRMAKVVNYGLIYGMTEFGLAQRLDIPHEEAMQFVNSYYDLYSGVAAWREKIIASAEQNGYVETLLGRRRPLPEITSPHHGNREFSKRAAINTPIQGSAADLIKIAMIDVEHRMVEAGFARGLLLSIHDELVFEIEKERIREAQDIIRDAMEHAMELAVPIEITMNTGKTWDEAH